MMNLDELSAMLDKVNEACKKIDAETTELEAIKKAEINDWYDVFRKDVREMGAVARKADLNEFAYPTNFKGHSYGHTCWFVMKFGRFGFRESGRVEKWTCCENPLKETVVNWYFNELDQEKFELAFKDAIMKATKEKVANTIKRNEDAKS